MPFCLESRVQVNEATMMKKNILLITALLSFAFAHTAVAVEYRSITGKVLDEVTKKGVPGVEVVAELGSWDFRAMTNDQGVFVLENLPPETYILKFSKENSLYVGPDHSPLKVVVPKKKNIKKIRYVLKHGASVSGTVVAADGVTPLPNVPVDIYQLDFWKTLETKWSGEVTDSEGKFSFYGLPAPNSAVVVIDYPGHASIKQVVKLAKNKAISDLKFIMSWDDITGVNGFVRTAQKTRPVPNIEVELRDHLGNIVGSALTDATGKYSILGVKPGSYQAGAFMPGVTSILKTVMIDPGKSSDVNFDFDR